MDQPTTPSSSPRRGPGAAALWANMAIIYVVWGSTYFGIAIAIETMPPFLMATIRFAVAGLMLLGFDMLSHRESRRVPTRRQLVDSFVVGVLLLGVGNGFVVFAEKSVPSGIAAILVEMAPLWFALLGWVYFRQRMPRLVLGAIAVGFAGTLLLIWPAGEGANRFDPLGILLLLLAELGWVHGSIYSSRRAKRPSRPLTASGIQMLVGAAPLTFVEALFVGEPASFRPEAISTASLVALAYLIFAGSMLAYTSYAWLLRNAPLSLVSTHAYVNPVVAVALGSLLLGEPLSLRTVVAAVLILAAVAIIVTARGGLTAEPATATDKAAGESSSPTRSAASG